MTDTRKVGSVLLGLVEQKEARITTTVPHNSALRKGIYTPAEAAFYARINVKTMQRWLHGAPEGERVIANADQADARVVPFLDFVQALAIHDIRFQHGVSLQKIREAVRAANDHYGIEYPLARRHTLYAVGKEIVIVPDPEDAPVELTGRNKHQEAMKPIIERFMRELHYGDLGYADKYTLFKEGLVEIEMDPNVRFGEPLIKSCAYTPWALCEAAKAEGSVDAAARLFGVQTEEVWAALRCFDLLEPRQNAA